MGIGQTLRASPPPPDVALLLPAVERVGEPLSWPHGLHGVGELGGGASSLGGGQIRTLSSRRECEVPPESCRSAHNDPTHTPALGDDQTQALRP